MNPYLTEAISKKPCATFLALMSYLVPHIAIAVLGDHKIGFSALCVAPFCLPSATDGRTQEMGNAALNIKSVLQSFFSPFMSSRNTE